MRLQLVPETANSDSQTSPSLKVYCWFLFLHYGCWLVRVINSLLVFNMSWMQVLGTVKERKKGIS